MDRQNFSTNTPFESHIAYSRSVRVADWLLLSGTTGYDYTTMRLAGSSSPRLTGAEQTAAQAAQALQNVSAALQQAGATVADVVRVTYVLRDSGEFEACWPVLREWFGEVRPAATMVQAGLMREEVRFEVEVTAFVGVRAVEKAVEGVDQGLGWGVWAFVGLMVVGWWSVL